MPKLTIASVAQKLAEHERVCSERALDVLGRIKRLENTIIGSAGAIIMLLLGILLK